MPAFNEWIVTDGCADMPKSLLNSMESLTITTLNTFPPVNFDPFGGLFMLIINATTYTPDDGSFTVTGRQINWTSSFISVNPGDTVVAVYSYEG
jgi:hypothetical protein